MSLPLFPLNTVLFPGMVLPLHIFEERYKRMIGRCLEKRLPFGVVLGTSAEGEPHSVGTTAIIVGVTYLEDGRYNLVTIGDERFRLRQVRHDHPYLVGSAEPWPFESSPKGVEERLVPAVRARFDRYLSLLASAEGHQLNIDSIPDDARGLAMLVAVAAQVPMEDKQRLLCRPSIGDVLRAEQRLLQREELILDYVRRTQAGQQGMGYSGWLAAN